MNIIPQLFYDLIARIIPILGLLFLGLLLVIPNIDLQHFDIKTYESVPFFALLVTLSIFYIISIILKTPAEVLSNSKFIKSVTFVKDIEVTKYKITPSVASEKFATIRYKVPEEGVRLLKMLAEIRLCEMLIFGLCIAIISNIVIFIVFHKFLLYRLVLLVIFYFSIRSLLLLKASIRQGFISSVYLISNKENY